MKTIYLVLFFLIYVTDSTAQTTALVPMNSVSLGSTAEDSSEFQISKMKWTHGPFYYGTKSSTVYNSRNDEFFVVWLGAHNTKSLDPYDNEIWGQRISASNASLLGSPIKISKALPSGINHYVAGAPAVAYNSDTNEYFVVWSANDPLGTMALNKTEIVGQRIDAATGKLLGSNNFRISFTGSDTNANLQAHAPAVAYDSIDNRYLVVWQADPANEQWVINGRLIDGSGVPIGTQFSINAITGSAIDNFTPKVIFAPDNYFTVVWRQEIFSEAEIYARNVHPLTTALQVEKRITRMGTNFSTEYGAFDPDIAYNPTTNQHLIIWSGNTNDVPTLNANEMQIFGQLVDASTLTLQGTRFRVSQNGDDSTTDNSAVRPKAIYNSTDNEYFVLWRGENNELPMSNGEYEIFGQRLTLSGTTYSTTDVRLSQTGPDGDADFFADFPSIAFDPARNSYFMNWEAAGWGGPYVDDEIYGRFFVPYSADLSISASPSPIPFDTGDILTYRVSLTNAGPQVHDGPFTFTATLPAGLKITNLYSPIFYCSESLNTIFCWGSTLGVGSTDAVVITAQSLPPYNTTLSATFEIVGRNTDPNLLNNTLTIQTVAQGDADFDGIPNLADTDDDNDTLLDTDEALFGTNPLDADSDDDHINDAEELREGSNPLDADTDKDGVLDGQEIIDGTSPTDAGSVVSRINSSFCSEWNGFLGEMYNVMEYVNLSSTTREVTSTLFSITGQPQSQNSTSIFPGAEADILVHDMEGRIRNSYGKVCATHDGQAGDIDGRMVYYKPGVKGFDFAFAMPFQNGLIGSQFVSFNTFQPSLEAEDSSNLVTNWIQITNKDGKTQKGTLLYYDQQGSILATEPVLIAPSSRQDFSAHRFGRNLVGMIEWRPEDLTVPFQLRNVRYYYNNPDGRETFDAAYQLEGMHGNGQALVVPLDATEGSAILEIANVTDAVAEFTVTFFAADGTPISQETRTLSARASEHLIADSLLNHSIGSATIDGATPGSIVATAMHYGRSNNNGIQWVYGIQAKEPQGSVLRGSYNTFLKQDCQLVLVNELSSSQNISISMTRYDGTAVLHQTITLPANSSTVSNICIAEEANNYGVVTVQPDKVNSVAAYVIRHGENDDYRFPTPVRE